MRTLLMALILLAMAASTGAQVLLVDDFETDATTNRLGGAWVGFSAGGDRYISKALRDLGGAGHAMEATGSFPRAADGTYGGLACELTPGKSGSMDLTGYTHLVFEATALRPSIEGFVVRIDNAADGWQVPSIGFAAGPAPTTVRVPLAGLPGLDRAVAVVWTVPSPRPGAAFGLRLDNVRFERIDGDPDARLPYFTDFAAAVAAHHRLAKPLVALVYQKGVGKSDEVVDALRRDRELLARTSRQAVLLLIDAEKSPELMAQLKIVRLPAVVSVARPNAGFEVSYLNDGLVTVLSTIDRVATSPELTVTTTAAARPASP